MAVTITFSGQIDDVLYELRQLAAGHGPIAAPQGANIHGIGPDTDGGPNPDYVEPAIPGDPMLARAIIAAGLDPAGEMQKLREWRAAQDAPKPVEQRVAEAIAALPKRSRRTKAEMEAARAAEVTLAEATEAVLADAERETLAPSSHSTDPEMAAALDADAAKLLALGADPGPTLGEIETVELPETAPAPTLDDLKRALSTVLGTEGLGVESGRKLVASFGAKKLTDLNAVEWPLFISKANALVAGGAK